MLECFGKTVEAVLYPLKHVLAQGVFLFERPAAQVDDLAHGIVDEGFQPRAGHTGSRRQRLLVQLAGNETLELAVHFKLFRLTHGALRKCLFHLVHFAVTGGVRVSPPLPLWREPGKGRGRGPTFRC